jgi:hypothetical protein
VKWRPALGCAALAAIVAAVAVGSMWFLGSLLGEGFGGSPPTMREVEQDFQRNLKDREMIVAWVKAGKLKEFEPNSFSVILLPERYRHLSHGGGGIIVDDLQHPTVVTFFTYRGVTDNWSGFVYREDGRDMTRGDLGGDLYHIERKGNHWFWVAAT